MKSASTSAAIIAFLAIVTCIEQSAAYLHSSQQDQSDATHEASKLVSEKPKNEKTKPDQYELAILDLAKACPREKMHSAFSVLRRAKEKAFPALVKNLGNKTLAHTVFGANLVVRDKDGNFSPYHATISFACYQIIQSAIENTFPKSLFQYQVLNQRNVKTWLQDRKHMSLKEMRIEAAETALKMAIADLENSDWESKKWAIEYLRKNVEKVITEATKNGTGG